MSIRTPQFDASVYGPRREDQRGALGDEGPCDGGILRCYARRERDRWVDAENFRAEGLEVGALVDVSSLEVLVGALGLLVGVVEMVCWNACPKFFANTMLDKWIEAELVDGPLHCSSRSFMAGGKECHELIDQILVRKGACSDGY